MKYHLVGVGGIGMSAIARLLLAQGHKVTGSDLRQSKITDQLENEGAQIVIGHKTDTIANFSPDAIVYSAAISDYSPGYVELEAAKKLGIKTIKRSEMISELMKGKSGIAVSGMHGKTTVTAMIGSIMIDAKKDPTILVGGIMSKIESNARLGNGDHFVVEACEYDKAFLEFEYDRAVITNIEKEHIEYFKNMENIFKAFEEFIQKIPKDGLLVACIDNPGVKKIIESAKSRVITYGENDADVKIKNIKIGNEQVSFSIESEVIKFEDNSFSLKIPGKHNVFNAVASIIIAQDLGISEDVIRKSLEEFSGIKRRLEIYDEIDNVLIIDDYAHHPTEIMATLEALKEFHKDRRVITIFRPAQYSRNKALLSGYGKAFKDADIVLIPKTYEPAGRDREKKEVDSKMIVEEIEKNGKKVLYLPEYKDVIEYLKEETIKNDLVITMGLGPLYELTEEIVVALTSRQARGKPLDFARDKGKIWTKVKFS